MEIRIDVDQVAAAHLTFEDHQYVIRYINSESDEISRSLPVRDEPYIFHTFPAQLEALLPKKWHIDMLNSKNDKLELLIAIGRSVPGNLSFFKV